MKGKFSETKAAPRVKTIEESPLPRKEAAKKDSLGTKEGSPRVQTESGIDEGSLGIRSLSNDDFEGECDCDVDHRVVDHQEFVRMFEKSEESGVQVGHVVVIVPPFFDCS